MASVNALMRTLIQMLYGTALMAGSFSEAARCYQTAVEIQPGARDGRRAAQAGRGTARFAANPGSALAGWWLSS
jgi:hypothetical protein